MFFRTTDVASPFSISFSVRELAITALSATFGSQVELALDNLLTFSSVFFCCLLSTFPFSFRILLLILHHLHFRFNLGVVGDGLLLHLRQLLALREEVHCKLRHTLQGRHRIYA